MRPWQWIVVVLLVLATGLAYRVYSRKRQLAARPPSNPDPNVMMPKVAAEAVALAAEQGHTLDYSIESVQAVETILGRLHELRAAGKMSDTEVNAKAARFGAYIGEVLRRKYGGSWAVDHPVVGPGTFPIRWKDHESFPIGWCGKRILNGEEDNVWVKLQVLTSDQLPATLVVPRASTGLGGGE